MSRADTGHQDRAERAMGHRPRRRGERENVLAPAQVAGSRRYLLCALQAGLGVADFLPEPGDEGLYPSDPSHVAMHDQPESPLDRDFVWEEAHQPGCRIADETGQNAASRAAGDEPGLRGDARASDLRLQPFVEFGEVAKLGRIDQIRDVADQPPLGQFSDVRYGAFSLDLGLRCIGAQSVIGELRGDKRAASRARQHDGDIGFTA